MRAATWGADCMHAHMLSGAASAHAQRTPPAQCCLGGPVLGRAPGGAKHHPQWPPPLEHWFSYARQLQQQQQLPSHTVAVLERTTRENTPLVGSAHRNAQSGAPRLADHTEAPAGLAGSAAATHALRMQLCCKTHATAPAVMRWLTMRQRHNGRQAHPRLWQQPAAWRHAHATRATCSSCRTYHRPVPPPTYPAAAAAGAAIRQPYTLPRTAARQAPRVRRVRAARPRQCRRTPHAARHRPGQVARQILTQM